MKRPFIDERKKDGRRIEIWGIVWSIYIMFKK